MTLSHVARVLATLCASLFAALLASIVVYTITVVGPVYEALLDPGLAPSAPEARALLEHWGRLHLVRVALSLAALLVCLGAPPRDRPAASSAS